jgi:hypothetical protein
MRATLPILLLLTIAGCSSPDPFDKPGTWSLPPTGMTSNDTNLRTMLVNPNDAVAGTGEDTSVATESERPVELLVTGRRRPLPSVNASEVGAGGQQQQQQQPGSAGAAGGPGPQQ